jgi:predicted O-methyltransferase YrrM
MTVFQNQLPGFLPPAPATKEWLAGVKKISMLHTSTLEALYQLAGASEGTILEIGPYIGGSTVAMARALKDKTSTGRMPRRFITVEGGGTYTSHPHLPSGDILADLDANLRKAGVRERVEVVDGWTYDYFFIRKIQEMLGVGQVGLLVLDSNGIIRPEFLHWGPCLRLPCYLVIDDYIENGDANIKSPSIQPILQQLIRERYLEELAVVPWGTWFGKIVQPIRLSPTMTKVNPLTWRLNPPFTPLGRIGWVTSLGLDDMPKIIEGITGPNPGTLRMFEGSRPLGPPDSPLPDLKERGRGAYHQWGGKHSTLLMFTTSDNSDPNHNGRTYTIQVGL